MKKDIIVYDTTFNDYRIEVVFLDTIYQAKKEYQDSFRVNVYYKNKLVPDSEISYEYFCRCNWTGSSEGSPLSVISSNNNNNKLIFPAAKKTEIISVALIRHNKINVLNKSKSFKVKIIE